MAVPKSHQRKARRLIGRNIKRLRLERGLTQEGVSLESGLMQSYVSEVEAGKRNVSIDAIATIALTLGVPLAWLFEE